jgi:hypothetical protein
LPSSQNPTYGSGGGSQGGRGGGRIILSTFTTLSLQSNSQLRAEGATSLVSGYGAGSGGSVLLLAQKLFSKAYLSVKGGDGNEFGSAGGGGRIAVFVSRLFHSTSTDFVTYCSSLCFFDS